MLVDEFQFDMIEVHLGVFVPIMSAGRLHLQNITTRDSILLRLNHQIHQECSEQENGASLILGEACLDRRQTEIWALLRSESKRIGFQVRPRLLRLPKKPQFHDQQRDFSSTASPSKPIATASPGPLGHVGGSQSSNSRKFGSELPEK